MDAGGADAGVEIADVMATLNKYWTLMEMP